MEVGDRVQVRTFSGAVTERRIAGFTDEGEPLICTDEEYNTALAENREPLAVGWPKEHIIGLVDSKSIGGSQRQKKKKKEQ